MTYLLDTCVIIDLVKGDPGTIDAMKSKSPDQVNISAITEFELMYGLAQTSKLKSKSKSIVEAMLSEINILDFASKEAATAAEIRNHLRALGTPIGPYDFLIAATALANDLVLVTSNEKEFARVENLQIENWRQHS
ncbi:PIN domain-containing protein [uncultured Imperialibacter sp.]|uniref:PIN domain-containing protein n=1 Tax=uncultured Imperialibacter sp. TaxID=1672639 RepID=UPI0030DC25C2|tara:strand:+ start:72542 stop:72949 length:408 start_codon:yes stop_codon:yes gene_type:complete